MEIKREKEGKAIEGTERTERTETTNRKNVNRKNRKNRKNGNDKEKGKKRKGIIRRNPMQIQNKLWGNKNTHKKLSGEGWPFVHQHHALHCKNATCNYTKSNKDIGYEM